MAYRHYETEGLIIADRPIGEANRLYRIFTRDFGLIQVMAQGVRLEKSKLRYNLNNSNFVSLNLVRGREYWRLVGADKINLANKNQKIFCRKIGSVLIRLIHGEEANYKIFSDLKQAWSLLEEGGGQLDQLEIFIMARLLANLGYLASSLETEKILSLISFSWPEINDLMANKLSLIKLINLSLAESGL